jgi:hypothetical protein
MGGPAVTVVITWLDGKQETYTCGETRVADGVLYLIQPRYPATVEPARGIPLAGVRSWTEG